jgi:hypothetical protein
MKHTVLYFILGFLSLGNIFYTHATPVMAAPDSVPAVDIDATATKRFNLEDSLHSLYSTIGLAKYDLSYEAFRYGMIGYAALRHEGKLNDKNLFTIIDFTKPSTQKRFYTLDMNTLTVKFYTYVSHGRNTGENVAQSFSNTVHSNQSSLGFYVTAETYIGSKGYSLKLDGMDAGYNDNMRERAVVMHDADYVSESWIRRYGRLGRSQGCPALPKEISKEVIDAIKGHTAIFAYYDDINYLTSSRYLRTYDALIQPEEMMARRQEPLAETFTGQLQKSLLPYTAPEAVAYQNRRYLRGN